MDLIIPIGIPGSGKTTFYERHFSQTHDRLSLDQLKTRQKEASQLTILLASRMPIFVDNTNLTSLDRSRYIMPAKLAGYLIKGFFFEPDRAGSLRRNSLRTSDKVPPVAIYTALKRLERPILNEGFDELLLVNIAPSGGFTIMPFC